MRRRPVDTVGLSGAFVFYACRRGVTAVDTRRHSPLGQIVFLQLACLALLTACSLPAAQVEPLTGTPETADRPTWQVGDSWTYREQGAQATRTDQVSRDADGYVLKRGNIDERRVTPSLSLSRILVGGESVDEFTPAIDYFQWPLEVGKPWRVECECKRKGNPNLLKVLATVKVESYEEISVPAGSFPAYRVYYRDGFGGPPQIYWYAPAVKNWVRWEDYRDKTVWELKAFQLAKGQ